MRQRQQNIRLSSNAKLWKPLLCKNKKSINCVENLSNEIIYEIQFSSESESILEYRYKQFIYPNKHRIISFHFHNQFLLKKFFTLCTIDSSFNHLESLILHKISTFKLAILLFYLKSLPRLFSLTVFFDHCHEDLGDIYQIIFNLNYLKYFKVEISDYEVLNLTVPIATNEQYSSIEYLSIYHYCTLNELTNILSYTPRLTHLYCYSIIQSEDIYETEVLMKLNNLVHLTISIHHFTFDEFEKFIVNLSSQLRLLSTTFRCTDKSYLDGNRWEKLIIEHIPYLTKFIFSYTDDIDNDFEITSYHSLINRFISPFWIKRQWIFRVLVENDNINYLIRPYTERLYDFQEHRQFDTNSLIHYYPGVNINITKILHTKKNQIFINKISPLIQMVDVTRLVIECSHISANTFIKIVNLLPNLNLIRITLLSTPEDFFTCDKDVKSLCRFLNNNKITKLTLRNITELEHIYFIIDLFPRVQYFAIQSVSNVDLQLVVESTLRKIKKNNIHHPMTLCVIVVEATVDKIEKLKKMIDSKNLLKDYIITRRYNKFYIQWERQ